MNGHGAKKNVFSVSRVDTEQNDRDSSQSFRKDITTVGYHNCT